MYAVVVILNLDSPYSQCVLFSLHLVCSLLVWRCICILSVLYHFICRYHIFIGAFSPTLSLNFLLSPFIFHWNSFSLRLCICLSVAWFLVYHFCQRAVVWDIPVYTLIDYRLSSFIEALLSCKIAQGSFFSLGSNLLVTFIQEWPSLGLCFRDKQCYHFSLGNPAIVVAWFKQLPLPFFVFVYIFAINVCYIPIKEEGGKPLLLQSHKGMWCLNLRWLIN